MLTLQTGQKGRFKASEREFEIVCTHGATTCIRFRYEQAKHGDYEFQDADLTPLCDNIIDWGIRVVDKK